MTELLVLMALTVVFLAIIFATWMSINWVLRTSYLPPGAVTIEPDVHARIKQLARTSGTTPSELATLLLRSTLSRRR